MKATSFLILMTLALAPRQLAARVHPDFSGTWTLNTGGTPQDDGTRAAFTTLIVKQTPNELSVEGLALAQHLPVVVYRLDGVESTSTGPQGATKAKAIWDGRMLVITSTRTFAGPQGDFHVDTKEVYSLPDGGLRIDRTQTVEGRPSLTDTFAYTKATSPLAPGTVAQATRTREPETSLIRNGPAAGCPQDPMALGSCLLARAKEFAPPRASDGRPDLQGYWAGPAGGEAGGLGRGIERRSASPLFNGTPGLVVDPPDGLIPYQPWALAERERRQRPENALEDPELHCYNAGVPRQPYIGPSQILQTADHLVILYELTHSYRIITMDGRPHLPKSFHLWQGDSVGHWEGDTLVVETTNNNGMTYVDLVHSFLGPSLKVVERFTMVDPNMLYWSATVDDPTMFTSRWTLASPLVRQTQPGFQIFEQACHEENQDLEHIRTAIEQMKEIVK